MLYFQDELKNKANVEEKEKDDKDKKDGKCFVNFFPLGLVDLMYQYVVLIQISHFEEFKTESKSD